MSNEIVVAPATAFASAIAARSVHSGSPSEFKLPVSHTPSPITASTSSPVEFTRCGRFGGGSKFQVKLTESEAAPSNTKIVSNAVVAVCAGLVPVISPVMRSIDRPEGRSPEYIRLSLSTSVALMKRLTGRPPTLVCGPGFVSTGGVFTPAPWATVMNLLNSEVLPGAALVPSVSVAVMMSPADAGIRSSYVRPGFAVNEVVPSHTSPSP